MNKYGYAHEKMGAAIHILMVPAPDQGRAIAGAMHEFVLGTKRLEQDDDDLRGYVDKINRIMEPGAGTWEERANALDEGELHDLSLAFWELDRLLSRLYYGSMDRAPM